MCVNIIKYPEEKQVKQKIPCTNKSSAVMQGEPYFTGPRSS